MSKPWIAENGYLYAYCYVADYQCSGPAFGYLDWELGTYLFDDGDSYKPDSIAGNGVEFFNSNLLLSLLETHFQKEKTLLSLLETHFQKEKTPEC